MKLRSRQALAILEWRERLEAAVPCVLTPDCRREISRAYFSETSDHWVRSADEGLFDEEASILDSLGLRGKALCLGSGGGREAFALARRGFEVTGVEQVPALVEFSRAHARRLGVEVEFVESSLPAFDVGDARFEFITAANLAYSYIAARADRLVVLRRCRALLSPEGRCLLSFAVNAPGDLERRWSGVLRALARASGNPHYDMGDRVLSGGHFIHFFASPDDVSLEAREAGFGGCELRSFESGLDFAVLAI